MKRTFLYSALALVGVLLLGLIFFLTQSDSAGGSDAADSFFDPSRRALEDMAGGAVDLDLVLEDYREWSQYPPNSRPLRADHIDVIEYRSIRTGVQNMPIKANGELRESGYACALEPEHHTVTEGESLRIFLYCLRSGDGARVKVRLTEARLEAKAGERRFTPPAPEGNDSGLHGDEQGGDGVYTFVFRPRPEDWASVYLTTNFTIAGDASGFTHSLRTQFFSSPVAPARFTGAVTDRVEDGSLYANVELAVVKPGEYTIEANLFAGDEPVGYARTDAKLASGRQTAELEFFGKVIADAGFAGPYRLVGLRAYLNTDVIQPELLARSPEEVERFLNSVRDDRPKRMVVPYYTETPETAAYRLEQFSEREYDSPEKRERLQQLAALRDGER